MKGPYFRAYHEFPKVRFVMDWDKDYRHKVDAALENGLGDARLYVKAYMDLCEQIEVGSGAAIQDAADLCWLLINDLRGNMKGEPNGG